MPRKGKAPVKNNNKRPDGGLYSVSRGLTSSQIEDRMDQDSFTTALDKDVPLIPKDIDVTCGPVPSCMPMSSKRVAEEPGGPETKAEESRAEDSQQMQKSEAQNPEASAVEGSGAEGSEAEGTEAPADTADESNKEAEKASNATSFWSRISGSKPTDSASLQTGRGNKVVARSFRDAREDAVCKVIAKNKIGSGMFVMFKGNLGILTNNHIIGDEAQAKASVAVFQTASMGTVQVALNPDKFFHSSAPEALDYTFVACTVPAGVQAVEISLDQQAMASVRQGDTIVIVQHPEGGEKSVAIGPVVKVDPKFVSYEADTEIGSSGGPVLKDYEPVALHHRAPRNEESKGLFSSISCYAPRTKSNKGVLIAAIVADLDTKLPHKRKRNEPKVEDKAKDSQKQNGGQNVTAPGSQSSVGILARLRESATSATSCVPSRKPEEGDEESEQTNKWNRNCAPNIATPWSNKQKENGVDASQPSGILSGKIPGCQGVTGATKEGETKQEVLGDSGSSQAPEVAESTSNWRQVIMNMDKRAAEAQEIQGEGKLETTKDKPSRSCGISLPGMSFGSTPAQKEVSAETEENFLMRAGIAGHGLFSATGAGDSNNAEEIISSASPAIQKQQCGVGLVLEAWQPKGLAQALNIMSRTYQAVRVDEVVGEGPADYAMPRIEKGDLVKTIDGATVTSLDHAKKLILGDVGSKVVIGFVRKQYPFEVTVVRGLRGDANLQALAVAANAEASEQEQQAIAEIEAQLSEVTPQEPEKPKFVKGIPQLYSRAQKKQQQQDNGAGEAQPPKEKKELSALDAKLKQMGVNSFSGLDDDGEDEEETPVPKNPLTRFTEATAPKMRGVIASGSGNATEVAYELLDKASLGDVAAIRKLVGVFGANVNVVDTSPGWGGVTPLINAATSGSRGAVMALLLLGANINAQDENGWTALHRAAGKGHSSVVTSLTDSGADITVKDNNGLTAADWARFCGHEKLAESLAPNLQSEEDILAEVERLQAKLSAQREKKKLEEQNSSAIGDDSADANATKETENPSATADEISPEMMGAQV